MSGIDSPYYTSSYFTIQSEHISAWELEPLGLNQLLHGVVKVCHLFYLNKKRLNVSNAVAAGGWWDSVDK